ncbi:predicted protein [Nematostella vectensis]|uniref:small monomeric GTPase n=1 Tax=Nematostella vectensis TaxID=45351 RepID=A7RZG3_NEMVE|nr:predicted protein [Nematostella vectensis]|eukprot:XP_001635150.1 predicted protein [Nematostella vectensis]
MRRRRASFSNQNVKNVRIVIFGKDGVGKSALTVRFITRRFIGEYDPCLEASYRHHLTVHGQYIAMDVVDTAGKNTPDKVDALLEAANIVYLLYSVTDRASFEEAAWLARRIQQNKATPGFVTIVVATNKDLKHLSQVLEYEGRFLAQELDGLFVQVSISEGYVEVQELLEEGIKTWLQRDVERARGSALDRVREGLRGRAKSFKKRSSVDYLFDLRKAQSTTL